GGRPPRRSTPGEAVYAIARSRRGGALRRRPVTAASRRLDQEYVAAPHADPDFLGLEHPHRAPARLKPVAMGQAVLATEETVRRVADAVACGVGDRRLFDVHPQAQLGPAPAAMHSVAG